MQSRATGLAFAIGLALTQRAWAGNTFEAVLLGANAVPGPGIEEGSFDALVIVDGTKVSLTLTPKEVKGWMSAHIHRGVAGVAGRLLAEFPWATGDGAPRTSSASVSAKVAADLIAHPERFYVDVHTDAFPAGAARGQLAPRTNAEVSRATPFAAGIVEGAAAPAPPEPPAPPPSGRRAQTIAFRPPRTAIFGDPDFSLEASASSGLSVFFTGTGDCAVNDSTVHILSAGKCFVTARQRGDGRFDAAPDVDQLIPIAKAGQRILGFVPAQKTYLDPDFPLALSATSGLPIVFDADGDCLVDESYVHITGAGECVLTAHQPGDPNYLAAQIVDQRFPIAKADQSIDFEDFPSLYLSDSALGLVARASSNLPVSFEASGSCAVVGPLLQILGSGDCSVTALQPGDRNFNAAPPVTRAFQIVLPTPP